jgi:Cysteine rich repeat
MRFALIAPLAAMLLLSPQLAFADDAHPCNADRDKFCKGMKPAQMHQCMKQHEAELSPACTAQRQQRKDARKTVAQTCKDDAAKFCPNGGKGQGGLIKCLGGHASEVQSACQEALKQAPAPGGK